MVERLLTLPPVSTIRLLLLPGSLRAGSTNVAVLRTAAEHAGPGIETSLYQGARGLPHFTPDDDPEGGPVHPAVTALRTALHEADAVLICTPEYAGALPGSFKNVLEWTVGDASAYRKPAAWINASSAAAPTGGAGAHDSLRRVLGYVGAEIVEDAVVRLPVERAAVGADGLIGDPQICERIASVVATLATHVEKRGSQAAP